MAIDCDSELPDVTGVGNRGEKRNRNKDKDVTSEKSFQSEVGNTLSGLAHQAMVENRDRVRRTVNEHKVMQIREADVSVKEALCKMEQEAIGDLLQIESQMLAYEKKYNLEQKAKSPA